jgi:hypothetical protein
MAKYLTIEEYANLNNVSTKLIYTRIRRGVLESTIIDGNLHIKLNDENRIFNAISEVENIERLSIKYEEQSKQIRILEALVESKERENRTLGAYIGDMKQAIKEQQQLITPELEIPAGYKTFSINELVDFFKEQYTLEELKEQIVKWVIERKIDYHKNEIIAPMNLATLLP